ncbi:DUF1381 domain-containing protein [Staphylococcus shinii]|uniref:DUF1381 domain-containing protein n=1 Tax=Staphylococcus shinii TaxID=2912228 RepID=UPI0012FF08EC|nr:DUF1381 domain-containing protein [Staphylococcus shinii]
MQYLIRTLTDSTGHPFTHVTQARDNESYQVVEAESKEEVKELYRQAKLRNGINSLANGMRNMRKAMQRKDSE